MSRSFSIRFSFSLLVCCLAVVAFGVRPAWGQAASQGSVNVTVLDPEGKVVPGATLSLQDPSTNDMRTARHVRGWNLHVRQPVAGNLQADGGEEGFSEPGFHRRHRPCAGDGHHGEFEGWSGERDGRGP